MIPSRTSLEKNVPHPRNTEIVLTRIQTTEDIVLCIVNSLNLSRPYLGSYAGHFKNKNIRDTCEDIWHFMKENFIFNPETGRMQTGRTIRYIIHDPDGRGEKYFDCKHFSTFALATCLALGIKSHLRLCGYDRTDPFPTHVYVVAFDEDGEEIIIDGTLGSFNQESNAEFYQNVHMIKQQPGLHPGKLYTANEIRHAS